MYAVCAIVDYFHVCVFVLFLYRFMCVFVVLLLLVFLFMVACVCIVRVVFVILCMVRGVYRVYFCGTIFDCMFLYVCCMVRACSCFCISCVYSLVVFVCLVCVWCLYCLRLVAVSL